MRSPLLALLGLVVLPVALEAAPPAPNVVLILADDLGYGDVGCFGAKDIRTPNIDRLAREGRRFSSFYVSQAVCTASRAALMTGCLANRVGLFGALNHHSATGIHPDELLLPEIFREKGYATAMYGKWHLGHRPMFSPLKHGFDEFFGIPYSNDNGRKHPVVRDIPPLPLISQDAVVGEEPEQSQFTRQFTERAVAFIEKNRERPFFVYLPHVMPHVPIFASQPFQGRSSRGLYGDVVEELDWSVGEILETLRRNKLDEKTLVIFLSDNGPFLSYGHHAGVALPFREGKLTTFEGGMRSPCVMRWPGQIPADSTCDEIAATIDFLPTMAELIGFDLPGTRVIDGRSIVPLLKGEEGAKSPHESYAFYAGDELQAIRMGDWKLHFEHDYLTVAGPPGKNGKPANYESMKPLTLQQSSGLAGIASRHGYKVAHLELSLFNLRDDPGETKNLASTHPEIVRKLSEAALAFRSQLGDRLTGTKGTAVRPAGRAE